MFFINLKIALRSLLRSRTYTFLSITSLVMGFIGFIFMLLYTNYENSYEKWIPDNSAIYRIDQKQDVNPLNANTPGPLANAVQNELPEIEYATGLQKFNVSMPFYSGINNSYTFKNLYGVDSSFLKIFPLKLKYGSFKDFYSPQTIILSEKVSEKFFGNTNPVGKTISMGYNLGMDFTIAGVLENPAPTHLDLEAISWYPQSSVSAWNTGNTMPYTTYVEVKKNVSVDALDKKIENLYRRNLKQNKSGLNVKLEPINKIHLDSLISGDGNLKLLIAIVLLAGLLLAISCLNFINLVIAKSSTRNKEIAIKKVLGTGRISLIKQFLSETFLQTFISFLIASGLLFLLMPYLKNIVGIQDNLLSSLATPKLIIELIASVLIISIITGLYPALIISGKKVSTFLKGSSSGEKGKSAFRSVLLVIQFTIAISFIISLVFINKQIHYMQNKELGFDPYKVLSISTMNFYATPDVFGHDKIRLLEVPNVENATVTSDVPGEKLQSSVSINANGNQYHLKSMTVDYDYFKTLDIPLAEGRDFSKAYVGDSTRSVILNQSALQQIHLKSPVGKSVQLNDSAYYTIIGVCKDYFNNGFSENIPPVAYTMTNPIGKTERPNILLKVGTGNIMATVEKLKILWTSVSPMDPQLRFSFLDEDYQKLFVQSERLSRVLKIVSYLSLLISLMGLFGLSSYILSQRKKELSIRKVIGASVIDIFLLVNKNFVKLILLSTLFAFTLSYLFIKNWLTNYAYQANINIGIFVVVLFIILFLTIITVTLQSYKTIRESPVKNLKSE
ncbi:MAG TPA: ABC transporter permease [Hanamia sp.]